MHTCSLSPTHTHTHTNTHARTHKHRWRMASLAIPFQTWQLRAEEQRSLARTAAKVATRWMHACLVAPWLAWCAATQVCSREKCSRNQSSKSCQSLLINSPANHCVRQLQKDVRRRGQIVAKRWLRAEVAPAWYKWRALHETKIRLAAACDKIVRRWHHRPLSMCVGAWHERLCKMRRAALLMRNSKLAAGWRTWSFNVQELVRRTRLLTKAFNRGFIKHRRALTLAVEVTPAQTRPDQALLFCYTNIHDCPASIRSGAFAFRSGENMWWREGMQRASCSKWRYGS